VYQFAVNRNHESFSVNYHHNNIIINNINQLTNLTMCLYKICITHHPSHPLEGHAVRLLRNSKSDIPNYCPFALFLASATCNRMAY